MKVDRLQILVYSLIIFLLLPVTCNLFTVSAIVDPLAVPNNKVGIHIIQATPDESSPAASLVNNNGDWGYITVLIEAKDRDEGKWQEFFNDLRRRHLIPLVRLATKPVGETWERPYEKEYEAWADFLDNLNWPTKNRYVIIYNEPNHGREWGGFTDPQSYAQVLNKTIDALKQKSEDFFVLNAGLDASTPHQPPNYFDEAYFLREMEKEVPGILNKLDGWVSHSYPNPAFAGSPQAFGRGTLRGWLWELQLLRSLGVTKNLPVFITETGWKHAQGINFDKSLPTADVVANYYQDAFNNAWVNERIVAITPFLLSYQGIPFDHFSFKKLDSDKSNSYYPQYQTIANLPKTSGQPIQENKAELIKGEVYSSIVAGEHYQIELVLKNIGQSIWDEKVKLISLEGGSELGIEELNLPAEVKVEPEDEHKFIINLKAPNSGSFKVKLNLINGDKQFDSPPLEFTTEVKSPVILQVKTNLKWKENFGGEYILKVGGVIGQSEQMVSLDGSGSSAKIEARSLLPDYTFEFILERPNYYPKTIKQKVSPGLNLLDFGTLQPALLGTILNPRQFWQLLPFSN